MASTKSPKNSDEKYIYAILSPFTNRGDHYIARVQSGSPNTLQVTVGSETGGMAIGDVAFVIALTAVREATKIMLNATDFVEFAAGDPQNTLKKKTLTVAISAAPTVDTTDDGKAGDNFVILADPTLDPTSLTAEDYIQEWTPGDAGESERGVYNKGVKLATKRVAQTEDPTMTVAQFYAAEDKGLYRFKGRKFCALERIDENRMGVVSVEKYYWNLFSGQVAESGGGGDVDITATYNYTYDYKGVIIL